jgi:ethanolamine utilization protein EutA (predicted chaperonin)
MASVELYRGDPGPTIKCLEAATQTFDAGDLVKLSSGYAAIATSGAISGIAHTNATGTTSTSIDVELLNPNSIYKVTYHADAITQALVGDLVDFTVLTAGAHTVEESGATTDAYVVELIDPVGTTSGKLGVRFLGALLTATT